ncbi:MAG: hypothetical protein ACQGVK_02040 [Myxococcota bacterium]
MSLATTLTFGAGCASYRDARDSRAAHRECIEDPDRSEQECEALRDRANQTYDRYEEEARRTWSCRNLPDGCGDERGP